METLYLQILVNGIVAGLIYALVAVGLSLVYGIQEVVNFAHGELFMLGAFAMFFVMPYVAQQYFVGVVLAGLLTGAAGWAIHRLLLAELQPHEFERGILMTLGLSILLVAGVQYLLGSAPRMVPTQFGFKAVQAFGLRLPVLRIAAIGVAAAALVALWLVLTRTQLGRAMRAVASNREAAFVVGIPPRRIALVAFVIGSALAGLAGAALAPLYTVQPLMGQAFLFKAFALVVIGGLGSVPGAVAAGLLLGVVESAVGSLADIVWQEASVFLVMIAVLMIRPHGLFGHRLRVG